MDKQLTANSWLVTAGIVMKHKLASKALLLSSLFISLLMVGCSQEQEPQIEVKKEIISLSKENQKAFVHTMVSDYLLTSEQLQQKFSEFEKTGDASGFIDYRNQQWTPRYIEQKALYQQVLHRNKAYIYRHQLESLFQCYDELQKQALHLKHSLQDKDAALKRTAFKRLKQDRQKVTALLRVP